MGETTGGPTVQGDAGIVVPSAVRRLRLSLDAAFHAFDGDGSMTPEHRQRVIHDIAGEVADAASAAARAGYPSWAGSLVREAEGCPPLWAGSCTEWATLLDGAMAAIDAADDLVGVALLERLDRA